MNKESMRLAGIWNIVSGSAFIAWSIFYLFVHILGTYLYNSRHPTAAPSSYIQTWSQVQPWLLPFIYGGLIFISGIFARRDERWELAFAGSVMALPLPLIGPIAGIFLVHARQDWTKTIRRLGYGIFSLAGVAVAGYYLSWLIMLFAQ